MKTYEKALEEKIRNCLPRTRLTDNQHGDLEEQIITRARNAIYKKLKRNGGVITQATIVNALGVTLEIEKIDTPTKVSPV